MSISYLMNTVVKEVTADVFDSDKILNYSGLEPDRTSLEVFDTLILTDYNNIYMPAYKYIILHMNLFIYITSYVSMG